MTRNVVVRVAIAAVLVVALSTRMASADDGTCATTSDGAVCKAGYVFDRTVSFATSNEQLCTVSNSLCEAGAGHQDCCVKTACAALPVDYCPYGYKALAGAGTVPAGSYTVERCCERDTTLAAFPMCNAASSGGNGAVQATTADDASWMVQDGNGFTRSVGRFTGVCFSVKIDTSECTAGTKCCSERAPSYLQFKIADAMYATATNVKCKLSYGTAISNVNGIKRIAKWSSVGTSAADTAKFFNVPITWRKGAKTATVCLYSTNTVEGTLDCTFENICGVKPGDDATVPDDNGNYDKGCELRLIGRKNAASSACCAPTFAVESFDSTVENRLANGSPAGGTIELRGV